MNGLSNRVEIVEKRKRIGRGGSRGGTSGKGNKGQKSRSGAGRKISAGFEGGQMPLHRRLPKRGFKNTRFATVVEIINLEQLEKFFVEGDQVNRVSLIEKGLLTRHSGPVKLLGKGELSKKLIVTVDACSESALEVVKGRGGEVHFIKEA
jgi:large subunit ribosomal protein L15